MFLAFQSPHYDGMYASGCFRGKFATFEEAKAAALHAADEDDDCEVYDAAANTWTFVDTRDEGER